MKTATLIKQGGHQNVYQMNPPFVDEENPKKKYKYIVVSNNGFESLIFPSNARGDIVDYGDIGGLNDNISDRELLKMYGYTKKNPKQL